MRNSNNVLVVFAVLTSGGSDKRRHGRTTHISAGKRGICKGRDGLKSPNSYLVVCKIFTAGQDFNSRWVLDVTGWLLLRRWPQSQNVVKNLQSTILALIVLVGQTGLRTDKRANAVHHERGLPMLFRNIYFCLYLVYIFAGAPLCIYNSALCWHLFAIFGHLVIGVAFDTNVWHFQFCCCYCNDFGFQVACTLFRKGTFVLFSDLLISLRYIYILYLDT